jgi:hypothetical protein
VYLQESLLFYEMFIINVEVCVHIHIAGQKIVKALKRCRSVNGLLMFYLWSNPLTSNGQRIIGLYKSLTVNVINF